MAYQYHNTPTDPNKTLNQTNTQSMFTALISNKRNVPLGVKTLLLKNQYLLDLHHKVDDQNTYQMWRDLVENGEIKGLKAIKLKNY